MAKIDVKVPDIGDFKDVPVIEVLVKPGDVVKVDQSLITLECDKATMDVPSPVAGDVAEVVAKVGDKVSMGTLIARVESADGGAAQAPAPPPRRHAGRREAAAARQGGRARARQAPRLNLQGRADRRHNPRHRRLQRRAGHRDSGEGRRHGRGRAAAADARIRQGDDGRAVAGGRQDRADCRQGRRQSVDGLADREARRRRTGRADRLGPGGRSGGEGRGGRRRSARNLARCAEGSAAPAAKAAAGPALADFSGVFAGPAVRRLARELGLDLNQIKGTGEKGRITREDVKAALVAAKARGVAAAGGGAALPAIPAVDFAKFGPIETVPLSRIKRISGPRLHASWVNVPHVTHMRRGGHHRARRVPQGSRRRREERQVKALPRVVAAASHAGLGRDAESFPDFQRRAKLRPATL